MDLKSVITGVAMSIAGFFGCSKAGHTTAAKAGPTAQATEPAVKNLGILQMTNNYETCVSFGAGQDCRMVPKYLDRKNIQITLTLESKQPNGKTTGLSVVELQAVAEKPVEVSVGNTDFTFTPDVATE